MTKNEHAQALGRQGGSKKSEKKTAANKLNGKKGGYPKGRPRVKQTGQNLQEPLAPCP